MWFHHSAFQQLWHFAEGNRNWIFIWVLTFCPLAIYTHMKKGKRVAKAYSLTDKTNGHVESSFIWHTNVCFTSFLLIGRGRFGNIYVLKHLEHFSYMQTQAKYLILLGNLFISTNKTSTKGGCLQFFIHGIRIGPHESIPSILFNRFSHVTLIRIIYIIIQKIMRNVEKYNGGRQTLLPFIWLIKFL